VDSDSSPVELDSDSDPKDADLVDSTALLKLALQYQRLTYTYRIILFGFVSTWSVCMK